MSVQLSLRGIGIPFEKFASIPHTSTRAYRRAQLLEKAVLEQVSGKDIVGVLYSHKIDIQGILCTVDQGDPTDAHGYEIDPSAQVEDLSLLIEATQRIEDVVRAFL